MAARLVETTLDASYALSTSHPAPVHGVLARPGLARPANATAVPGLVLAGDYTASDYPATLEAAVRSGIAAANLLSA